VWTGTGNGGKVGLATCSDWSTTAATGTVGHTEMVGNNFSTLPAVPCDTQAPIYCFGVGQSVAISPIPVEGRRAFSTDFPFVVGGGLAAADAFCQSEAATRNLAGSFKAVLGTSTGSAASRFDLGGRPWVRLDGMKLTETAREFFEGTSWLTGVNVTPSSSYTDAYFVWAGGASLLEPGTLSDTCDDWTSRTGTTSAGFVSGATPATHFFYSPFIDCGQAATLLTCLEE